MVEVAFPTPSEVEERVKKYEEMFRNRYTNKDDDFRRAAERRSKPGWNSVPVIEPWPPRRQPRGRRSARPRHEAYHPRPRYYDPPWRQRGGRSPRNDYECRESPPRWEGRYGHSPPPSPHTRPRARSPLSPGRKDFRKVSPLRQEFSDPQPNPRETNEQDSNPQGSESHLELESNMLGLISPFETEKKTVPSESDFLGILNDATGGSMKVKAKKHKQASQSKKRKKDSLQQNYSETSTKKTTKHKEKQFQKSEPLIAKEDSITPTVKSIQTESRSKSLGIPHSKQSANMLLVSHGRTASVSTLYEEKEDSHINAEHKPEKRSGKEAVKRKSKRRNIVSDDDDESDRDVDVITVPDTKSTLQHASAPKEDECGSLTVSLPLPTTSHLHPHWSGTATSEGKLIKIISGDVSRSAGKSKKKKKKKSKRKSKRLPDPDQPPLTVKILKQDAGIIQ